MDDLYNCFHCDAINRATKNSWCCCVGNGNTLVCDKCGRCFCDAPKAWRKNVFDLIDRLGTPHDASHRRPIILIIDDDRVIHMLAARALAGFAGTVLHAYDGKEGLAIAQKIVPEVVMADCLMPLMDGREIARVLKSKYETRGIRVIAMTSLYRGARYRHEALTDFHVDDFIEKPLTAAKLQAIATAALQTRRAADRHSVAVVWP